MLHAVEQDGHACDFAELLGGFVRDGAAFGEGLADGAELAGGDAVRIAYAILQHGGGEHVMAVELGDFPVRNAIKRLQGVEAGLAGVFYARDRGAVAEQKRGAVEAGCGGFEG